MSPENPADHSPSPSPYASPNPDAAATGASSNSNPTSSPLIPDRASSPDLPLTMTASMVLTSLPRDATAALAAAAASLASPEQKVVVRFKPVGSAPALRGGERRRIGAEQKFEAVVAFLRRALRVGETESVFLYVNSTFAPALDEVVGNLHRCFKDSSDQLNVSYSMTPAFG
ncbi:hypothetical protein NKR23_g3120 [Pleurostoma richardsiae]|uniref:Ubiquitin-like protein ATG12 n=1 Tax=Pleurostoma richardsiae TaxID=41990 RepID=A0AA38RZJ7_9PEZI|nr:hypothetical protein NKR23_g3120 [Pleurostoma richardsiae]